MVEHDIGVECAILETKELVCGRLAVFISNRRRSPDIKYGCFSTLEFTAIYVYLAFVVRRHTCLHNASSHAATPMLGRYCIVSAPYDNDMAPDITPQYLIFANRNHASADDISHTYVHKGEPYPNYSLR